MSELLTNCPRRIIKDAPTFELALSSSLITPHMTMTMTPEVEAQGTQSNDEVGAESDLRSVAPVNSPSVPPRATIPPISADGGYTFVGRHFVGSYLGCDMAALTNQQGLLAAMRAAVRASGATLLRTCEHAFPGGAITVVMLLSESHASIHTYPEYAGCFVDLFTCGLTCRAENFDAVLRAYLQPKEVEGRMLQRARDVVDDGYGN
jgi:S-adenosylmethionine decarboxylase